MADTVQSWSPGLQGVSLQPSASRNFRLFMRRRSTIAFLMCLPLIVIITGLVLYTALYSFYRSMVNKRKARFSGVVNFSFVLSRDVFWMEMEQAAICALSAVFFKALI